jgi:hypothetical protein
MFVVGKPGGTPSPVGFASQVAVGVEIEGGCPAQRVGGGEFAVQTVDFMAGNVAERILFADQQIVVVEPMGGAAAGGVEV